MRNLSITARLMIIALGPALLVACLSSLYFIVERVRGIQRMELARANSVLDAIALAGEYGVVTGNQLLLESVGRGALRAESITAVRFTDVDGGELASVAPHAVSKPSPQSWLLRLTRRSPHIQELSRPVMRTDLRDFEDPLFERSARIDSSSRAVGRVSLTMDLSRLYSRQLEVIGRGLLITSLLMLLVLPAAWRLARSVSTPVRKLNRAINELARQRRPFDLPLTAGGELGELARGVQHLSSELEVFHTGLKEATRLATHDLHDALEVLERRNRELVEAREAAEKASASKSGFLANMSHEIRTPMNAIVGTLSMLRYTSLDEDQRAQLALVERSSTTLLALIDDILDISRIEAGRFEIEQIETDMDDLLREVSYTMTRQASERGIELRIDSLPAHATRFVLTDPLRLKQVLFNLLSNAIKFTAEGRVELLLKVGSEPLDDTQARRWSFSVVDTGIGIPKERQVSVFRPFTQVDMSTARRYGGFGLGLYICREIVTRMGGDISLTSVVDRGTRIDVTLRFKPARTVGSPTSGGRAVPAGATWRRGENSQALELARDARRPRVLAVDDQSINLVMLGRFFSYLDVEADLVERAVDAWSSLEARRYDLVLMDLHMPDEDGFQLARRLRNGITPNSDTPVLALTADAFRSTRERALAQGFDAVLTKPITVDRIGEVIHTWTSLRVPAVVGPPSPPPPRHSRQAVPDEEPEARPVSIEACAEAVFGDVDWAIGALAAYRDEVPTHVAALSAALSVLDRNALFQAAHAIKGVSDVCRVKRVARAAHRVTEGTSDADWPTLGAGVARLIEALDEAVLECGRVLEEVDEFEDEGIV